MRPIYNNILETIGNTPMIKLNKVAEDFPCPVYAKVEYFNPGHSVKDRMALQMIEDAEARGDIKPGGTMLFVDEAYALVSGDRDAFGKEA